MAVAYEVAGLTKRYPGPKEVLANDRIDLCIATGEIVGIFGPNGAGKTTLVRQLMGLLRPTAGQIRLFDNDLVREPTIATNHVAYFAQETSYFWYLKPRELLAITGRLRGLTSREANSQAYSLLGKFNLGNLAGKTLSRLSFGQARFVALLSVFMGNRPILILDEPTNDLDPLHRRAFWDYLWEVNSREGTTVLLVTHNVHEAEHVVHRVVIVDAGRIVASGTPGELKAGLEGQVRVEVALAEPLNNHELPTFAGCERLPAKRNTLLLQTARENVEAVIRAVYDRFPSGAVSDLRVVPPTLEDVYVQTVGKEWG
ncbi:MAG TPA: ABC transporter ATP-binding protein [Candidatus Bipolaricaulis anaerobius]|jgi:ABC-type multidrug transport system ATPase subunit|uniref:ABC transporter ATP-binding protein n=1 Tax=Candidatus Bipolaricaulis anaerobius TaxID=2026885 RepID=A0A2X3KZB2_9BACT|nr:ABC transporter ATP-binding protein [Candidatus Bipolaricaulis anaerobius]MDD5764601.1 ABC transporter ATP-binding protein [Candidatus Bipolaricaulis anaerobius]SQD92259.1 ABC transporter ATP-binding protein [Candidatus Bipolaricaulis anaerobius]HNR25083.1 ABC transporter ATP-binding protein [Candidatus Bipolaricaulis anaerobius]HNS24435.1 ABC transporter ATP-binding protein [Candidatus Bipolaricaulis anaerobius]